jgi:hypothetical protein
MNKEIVMNPDILPTQKEWRLICAMVKQQRELTDEEILQFQDKVPYTLGSDLIDFARAILKKASEK